MFDPIINGKLNRLLEAGGHSEPTKQQILAPKDYTFEANFVQLSGDWLVVGYTYTVIWDGKQYTCVCKEVDSEDGKSLIIGNIDLMMETGDSGEPFVFIGSGGNIMAIAVHWAINGEIHTFGITAETETIHPIDPKYLPVVKLSTTVANGATFTDAENEALNTAFAKGMPFVVKCDISVDSVNYTDCAAFACIGNIGSNRVVYWSQGAFIYMFVSNDGVNWVVSFS